MEFVKKKKIIATKKEKGTKNGEKHQLGAKVENRQKCLQTKYFF